MGEPGDVLRSCVVEDATARAVFAPQAFLAQPDVTAHAWAAVVGVGRLMAGPPASTKRRVAAAEVVSAVLRRVARRAGLGNRLRTPREPGPGTDEVCVHWAATDEVAAGALAQETAGLVAAMAEPPDEAGYLAAVREAGDRVGARLGRPTGPSGPAHVPRPGS